MVWFRMDLKDHLPWGETPSTAPPSPIQPGLEHSHGWGQVSGHGMGVVNLQVSFWMKSAIAVTEGRVSSAECNCAFFPILPSAESQRDASSSDNDPGARPKGQESSPSP